MAKKTDKLTAIPEYLAEPINPANDSNPNHSQMLESDNGIILTPLDDEDIFNSIEEMEAFADQLLQKYDPLAANNPVTIH